MIVLIFLLAIGLTQAIQTADQTAGEKVPLKVHYADGIEKDRLFAEVYNSNMVPASTAAAAAIDSNINLSLMFSVISFIPELMTGITDVLYMPDSNGQPIGVTGRQVLIEETPQFVELVGVAKSKVLNKRDGLRAKCVGEIMDDTENRRAIRFDI